MNFFQTPLLRPRQIGRLFSVPLKVAPAAGLLFLLPLLLASDLQDARLLSLSLLILFLALIGHEIAHALMAKRLGLRVVDITIWPLVGMARIEEMSHQPTLEAPVAAAGPLFNLLIAPLGYLMPAEIGSIFITINLIFGLGNLLPAFPMDGGRLLRAWFAKRAPLPVATKRAIKVSDTFLLLSLLPAAATGHLLITLAMSAYIWLSGRWELAQLFLRGDASPMSPPQEAMREEAADDLENFKGSMEEYFDAKKRR